VALRVELCSSDPPKGHRSSELPVGVSSETEHTAQLPSTIAKTLVTPSAYASTDIHDAYVWQAIRLHGAIRMAPR